MTAPEVRVQRELVIRPQVDPADLDAVDADWSRGNVPERGGDARPEAPYLGLGGEKLFVYGSDLAKARYLGQQSADYGTCADPQQLDKVSDIARLGTGEISTGDNFCYRTTAGRVALLIVKGEPSAQGVTFDVTVWQKS